MNAMAEAAFSTTSARDMTFSTTSFTPRFSKGRVRDIGRTRPIAREVSIDRFELKSTVFINDHVQVETVVSVSADHHFGTSADEAKFKRLAEQWRKDTLTASSPTKLVAHPAYLKIIGMGAAAIPILLRELQDDPDYWFAALSAITEDDPIANEDMGDLEAMSKAWIRWGQERGMI